MAVGQARYARLYSYSRFIKTEPLITLVSHQGGGTGVGGVLISASAVPHCAKGGCVYIMISCTSTKRLKRKIRWMVTKEGKPLVGRGWGEREGTGYGTARGLAGTSAMNFSKQENTMTATTCCPVHLRVAVVNE